MEEAASSSRTQESSSDSETNSSTSFTNQFLTVSDPSKASTVPDSRSSDSTDIAVPAEESYFSPIASRTCDFYFPEHQKSTDIDLNSDCLTGCLSNVPVESAKKESCDITHERYLSSSNDSSNKEPIDEMWTTDCRYSESLRKFRDALNRAADTVVDIVNKEICSKCPSRSARHPAYLNCEPSGYDSALSDLLRPLSPAAVPVLKDAAFLRAAHKGEGHALVHLFKMGARGRDATTGIERRNALHLACVGGWNRCVYILVDYKAITCSRLHRERGWLYRHWEPMVDIEAVDVYSKTPLDYAKKEWSYLIEGTIELKREQKERKKKKEKP